ncbi:hypothetical protein [Bradyrhizobium sp.]|uniref:hypothetical protein n=1 Tax=Bradyrhizobium sp. TaxID=376 RepID=UPI001ED7196B|nr:hypothetical protein [Bradyrhizobium sp.]MBV9981607.1 hypothetical protein [Bradyrhizobium sp.]
MRADLRGRGAAFRQIEIEFGRQLPERGNGARPTHVVAADYFQPTRGTPNRHPH